MLKARSATKTQNNSMGKESEQGFVVDANMIKYGDGNHAWS